MSFPTPIKFRFALIVTLGNFATSWVFFSYLDSITLRSQSLFRLSNVVPIADCQANCVRKYIEFLNIGILIGESRVTCATWQVDRFRRRHPSVITDNFRLKTTKDTIESTLSLDFTNADRWKIRESEDTVHFPPFLYVPFRFLWLFSRVTRSQFCHRWLSIWLSLFFYPSLLILLYWVFYLLTRSITSTSSQRHRGRMWNSGRWVTKNGPTSDECHEFLSTTCHSMCAQPVAETRGNSKENRDHLSSLSFFYLA